MPQEVGMMSNTHSIRQRWGYGRNAALLALLVGSVVTLPTSAGAYQLVDLGIDVAPTDINNGGTIVGSRQTATGSIAFRWLAGSQAEDIAGTTVANAVNEADQVTGTTLTGTFVFDGSLREWDGYSGFGINEAGQISGNKALNNPYRPTPLPLDPAIYTPDRWNNLGIATVYARGTRQGVYADLYVLDDINDAGFAIGSRRRYGLAGSSAILITPAFDAVTYLPIPNGGYAKAINSQNKVVGATGSNSTSGEYAHAYLYDYNAGNLLDLGTLNGGLTSSAADINESSQVVGTSWLVTQLTSLNDPTQYHAFLWENGLMTDLNTLIAADSGWILTAATAINDNGDIVGSGLLNGQVHAFLLTTDQAPPPPAAESPLAVASADVTSGKVPLTVAFSSTGSYDPDGTLAAYSWDFGDGSAVVHEANPSHTFTTAGTFIAVLTVTDGQGLSATAQVDITTRKSKGKP
jgi:probable HAF family extracellular repeat protein